MNGHELVSERLHVFESGVRSHVYKYTSKYETFDGIAKGKNTTVFVNFTPCRNKIIITVKKAYMVPTRGSRSLRMVQAIDKFVVNLDPYYTKTKMNGMKWRTSNQLNVLPKWLIQDTILKDVLPNTSKEALETVCPNLAELGYDDSGVPAWLRPLGTGRLKDELKKLVGVRGGLAMQWLRTKQVDRLGICLATKGLLPWDKVVLAATRWSGELVTPRHMRALFTKMPRKALLASLRTPLSSVFFRDTIVMFEALWAKKGMRMDLRETLAGCRDLRAVHDTIMVIHRAMIESASAKLNQKDYVLSKAWQDVKEQLESKEHDGWTVRLPTKPMDMLQWGHKMRHCIGSYARLHGGVNGIFVGMFHAGELKYNLQLDTKMGVIQFLGFCNEHPTQEAQTAWKHLSLAK